MNALLAQAGAPVRARRLRLSPLAIAASIRVRDSLQDGVSHFYAEIQQLRRVVDSTDEATPVLFLLDELLHGGRFGRAVWNTAYYALLSVPLSIVLGVVLAPMLSWKVRGQSIYRTLFFLPSVVPVVAASVLWMWLLDPQDGLLNYALSWVGVPSQLWFNGATEALAPPGWFDFGSKDALVLMSLWGVGNFIIT